MDILNTYRCSVTPGGNKFTSSGNRDKKSDLGLHVHEINLEGSVV